MKIQLNTRQVICLHIALLGGVGLISGCEPTPTQVVQAPAPTATPKPVSVVPTATPTHTMTPRQARLARAARRRAERAKRQAQEAERRRIAKADAEYEQEHQKEHEEQEAREKKAAVLDGVVTADEYNRVQLGMNGSDMLGILGAGKEISSSSFGGTTTRMYQWTNPDGSNATVMTQNGVVISKAQFGIL